MAATPTKSTKTKEALTALQGMTEEERAKCLDRIMETYCLSCGHGLDDDGDCLNEDCGDEDEDEEEGDEGEDEEDDEDDEDDEEDDEDEEEGEP